MKRFLFLTLTLLLMAGTAAFAQDKKQKKQADIQEVTFVTSIDCKNCVKKVEATKTDKEKLAAAIVKLGYEAEEVTPETEEKK